MIDAFTEAADTLTASLDEACAVIYSRLSAGVYAEVPLDQDVSLCWYKGDSGWGLYAWRRSRTPVYIPLKDAPLKTRREAAKALPLLWKAIGEQRENQVQDIEAAITEVQRFTRRMQIGLSHED